MSSKPFVGAVGPLTFTEVKQRVGDYIHNGDCDGSCNGGSDVCMCPVDPYIGTCGHVINGDTIADFADNVVNTGGQCFRCFVAETCI